VANANANDGRQRVPVQAIQGGAPLQCVTNVAKRVRALGGEAAFGWLVKADRLYEMHIPHCVWKSPEGRLQCVTPQYTKLVGDDRVLAEHPEFIWFIPDPALAWHAFPCPHRMRYVATDRRLVKACEHLTRSDACYYAGDLEGCRYWTEKANDAAKGLGVYWDAPEGETTADYLKAGLPPG
jgi:hypothetical protein